MRRLAFLAPATALLALAVSSRTASAQVADDYYIRDDVPRAYGYGYAPYAAPPPFYAPSVDAYGNVITPDRPFGRNGCGTYRFWDGERCVDARYR